MWEGMNQRRFPRVNYKCRIRVSGEGGDQVLDTTTENIGAGGICVVVDKEFSMYDKVSLEIFLDDKSAPISCAGTVVWVVKGHPAGQSGQPGPFKYDVGVEFTGLSTEDKKRVADLVEYILQAEA